MRTILRTRITNLETYGCLQVVIGGRGLEWQTASSVQEYVDYDRAHPRWATARRCAGWGSLRRPTTAPTSC